MLHLLKISLFVCGGDANRAGEPYFRDSHFVFAKHQRRVPLPSGGGGVGRGLLVYDLVDQRAYLLH